LSLRSPDAMASATGVDLILSSDEEIRNAA
jgi:hypothetical protein